MLPSPVTRHPAGKAESLLSAARQGSREALAQVMAGCRRYLQLMVEEGLGDEVWGEGEASMLVEQSLLEVRRLFASFQGSTEPELVAWLCRILLHHMGHFHPPHGFPEKHEVLRELPFDPQRFACEWQKSLFPNSFSAAGQAIRPEQIEALEACLALLPKRYRRVITLRHQKDCTFAAIGRQLECSANAARKLWWRAMKRLQDLLDSHPAT